jgi:hypothetical protein
MRLREAVAVPVGVATMMVALALSAPKVVAQGDNNPDVTEVRHYQLTLDKAQKTAMAMQSINQLIAANPNLSAAMDAGSETTGQKSITQQAQDINSKYPQVAAIIKQNGLTTREFIVATGAIINDMGWVGLKKQGIFKTYPAGMITPENAALLEANWDAFQAIGAKMTPPNSR